MGEKCVTMKLDSHFTKRISILYFWNSLFKVHCLKWTNFQYPIGKNKNQAILIYEFLISRNLARDFFSSLLIRCIKSIKMKYAHILPFIISCLGQADIKFIFSLNKNVLIECLTGISFSNRSYLRPSNPIIN